MFCWGFILLEIKVSFELTRVQGILFQPIVPHLVLVRVKKHSHQAILYLVTLPALVIPLLGSLIYFNLKDQSQLVQIIYGLVKVYTFLWPALAVFVLLKLPWSHLRGYFRLDAKMAKEGAICGFLMGSVILLTLLTPWGDLVRNQAEMVRQKATDMGIIRFFPVFALFISIGHSLLEEYYWRWFVFGQLHRCFPKAWMAHLTGAVGFAAHHFVVTTTFFAGPMGWFFGCCVGAAGAVWSWLMIRHQSILGAWLAHMLVDLCLMGVGYWLIFFVAPAN